MTRHAFAGGARSATGTGGAAGVGRGGRRLRWGRGCLVALVLVAGLLSPSAARAEEEDDAPDGRLEGYGTKVAYEKSSTVLTWFLFAILVMIGITSLFKTAKRE